MKEGGLKGMNPCGMFLFCQRSVIYLIFIVKQSLFILKYLRYIITFLFPSFFIPFVIGCGSSINIPKPQINNIKEPTPIELSLVNIPVSMNLKPVINPLEKNVPIEIRKIFRLVRIKTVSFWI